MTQEEELIHKAAILLDGVRAFLHAFSTTGSVPAQTYWLLILEKEIPDWRQLYIAWLKLRKDDPQDNTRLDKRMTGPKGQ